MTKEKAIKTAWSKEIEDFVDKIYYEFEGQICKRCDSYNLQTTLPDTEGVCFAGVEETDIGTVTDTFGCNKWKELT